MGRHKKLTNKDVQYQKSLIHSKNRVVPNEGDKVPSLEPGVLRSVPIVSAVCTDGDSQERPDRGSKPNFQPDVPSSNDTTSSALTLPEDSMDEYSMEDVPIFIDLDTDKSDDELPDLEDTITTVETVDSLPKPPPLHPAKVRQNTSISALPPSKTATKCPLSRVTLDKHDVLSLAKSSQHPASKAYNAASQMKAHEDAATNMKSQENSVSDSHGAFSKEAPESCDLVLSQSTVHVDHHGSDTFSDQWQMVDNILSRLFKATHQHVIVENAGHVSTANMQLVQFLEKVGNNLRDYGDKFLTVANTFKDAVEQREVDDMIQQDKERQELEYLEPLNPSSESDSPEGRAKQETQRLEIIRKRKEEYESKIQKQKASDLEVKGSIKVVRTNEGARKKLFWCDICEVSFSSKTNLNDHLRRHTSLSFECNLCKLKLKSKLRMRAHMKYHQHGPWKCNYTGCNKEFKWETSYINHRKSHFSKGKYICPTCKKSYVKKQNFVDHCENKHKSGKHVQCPLCTRKCKTKNALSVHLSLVHTERDEKGRRK